MVRRVPFQLLPVGEPFLDQFAGLRVMDGTAFHDHFGRPHCAPPGPTSEAAWVCFPGFPISNKMTTRLFSTGLCRWTGIPSGFVYSLPHASPPSQGSPARSRKVGTRSE